MFNAIGLSASHKPLPLWGRIIFRFHYQMIFGVEWEYDMELGFWAFINVFRLQVYMNEIKFKTFLNLKILFILNVLLFSCPGDRKNETTSKYTHKSNCHHADQAKWYEKLRPPRPPAFESSSSSVSLSYSSS
jgi:hypothetical protein